MKRKSLEDKIGRKGGEAPRPAFGAKEPAAERPAGASVAVAPVPVAPAAVADLPAPVENHRPVAHVAPAAPVAAPVPFARPVSSDPGQREDGSQPAVRLLPRAPASRPPSDEAVTLRGGEEAPAGPEIFLADEWPDDTLDGDPNRNPSIDGLVGSPSLDDLELPDQPPAVSGFPVAQARAPATPERDASDTLEDNKDPFARLDSENGTPAPVPVTRLPPPRPVPVAEEAPARVDTEEVVITPSRQESGRREGSTQDAEPELLDEHETEGPTGGNGGSPAAPARSAAKPRTSFGWDKFVAGAVLGAIIGSGLVCIGTKKEKCEPCEKPAPAAPRQVVAPRPAVAPVAAPVPVAQTKLDLSDLMGKRKKPAAEKPAAAPSTGKCSVSGAATIGPTEVPAAFKRAVVTGVSAHRTQLSGRSVEVTYLICPNPGGQKGAFAKVVKVEGAGGLTADVTSSVKSALDGKQDANTAIAQAKLYTQSVAME